MASGANVGAHHQPAGETFAGGEMSGADARGEEGLPAGSAGRRSNEAYGPVYIADSTRGIALGAGPNAEGTDSPEGTTSAEDTATMDKGCQLVVVYLNVTGIPKADIDSFFGGHGQGGQVGHPYPPRAFCGSVRDTHLRHA